jgi:hypothetical protein
VERG